MESTSPPVYSSTQANAAPSPVLLNLAPLTNHVDFLHGHLGYGPASLQGEVQIKLTGDELDSTAQATTPRPSKLEVRFRGVERRDDVAEIELCDQRKTLWGWGAQGSSSTADQGDLPSPSTSFKLDVTQDLPHCIHLPHSSLEYMLTAMLYFDDPNLLPIIQCVPIHLSRTSAPGQLLSDHDTFAASEELKPSTSPQSVSVRDPIQLSARFSRTVYRRSEPIELVVKIAVPDVDAVTKGLRLRTVSAELVRHITLVGVGDDGEGRASGKRRDTEEGSESHAVVKASTEEIEEVAETSAEDSILPVSNLASTTVLARSGKSARFSPTRPIVIRLLLHPPSTLSCESITQSTILHHVTFSVVVTVGLFIGRNQNDVVVSRNIFIVPDPPANSIRNKKQREVESEIENAPGSMLADGPVPAYHESPDEYGEASSSVSTALSGEGSSRPTGGWESASSFGEEEYDGYEEVSASLSTRPPPPTIDEDVSPPSHDEEDDSDASIESFIEVNSGLEETMTPPPDDFAHFYLPVDHSLHARRRELDSDEEDESNGHIGVYTTSAGVASFLASASAVTTSTPPSGVDSSNSSETNSPAFQAVQDSHTGPSMTLLDEASPPPYVGDANRSNSDSGRASEAIGVLGADRLPPLSSVRPPPPSYTSHQDVILRLTEQGELVRMVRDVEGVV